MTSEILEAATVFGFIYGGAIVALFYATLIVMAFSKR